MIRLVLLKLFEQRDLVRMEAMLPQSNIYNYTYNGTCGRRTCGGGAQMGEEKGQSMYQDSVLKERGFLRTSTRVEEVGGA